MDDIFQVCESCAKLEMCPALMEGGCRKYEAAKDRDVKEKKL